LPRSPKEFHEYLAPPTNAHVGHDDYLNSPATAFLKYTVEAKSSVDLCIRRFTRKAGGAYRKDSLDSLQHLVAAMLPAVMGHFETYQRYLFAGMFDLSAHLVKFDVDAPVGQNFPPPQPDAIPAWATRLMLARGCSSRRR